MHIFYSIQSCVQRVVEVVVGSRQKWAKEEIGWNPVFLAS